MIGFYAYDYIAEQFKQDFIVNVGGTSTEFALYMRLPIDEIVGLNDPVLTDRAQRYITVALRFGVECKRIRLTYL